MNCLFAYVHLVLCFAVRLQDLTNPILSGLQLSITLVLFDVALFVAHLRQSLAEVDACSCVESFLAFDEAHVKVLFSARWHVAVLGQVIPVLELNGVLAEVLSLDRDHRVVLCLNLGARDVVVADGLVQKGRALLQLRYIPEFGRAKLTSHTSFMHVFSVVGVSVIFLLLGFLLFDEADVALDLLFQISILKLQVLSSTVVLFDVKFDFVQLVNGQVSFLFHVFLHLALVEHVDPTRVRVILGTHARTDRVTREGFQVALGELVGAILLAQGDRVLEALAVDTRQGVLLRRREGLEGLLGLAIEVRKGLRVDFARSCILILHLLAHGQLVLQVCVLLQLKMERLLGLEVLDRLVLDLSPFLFDLSHQAFDLLL